VQAEQSQAARADWSLATQILLRKTRTDFCKTLLRRHCSRRLHAVVLHWRLACRCGGFGGKGGGDSGLAAGVCSGSNDNGSAGMDRGTVRRVTWERGGSRTKASTDASDGSSEGGVSAGDGGAVS
jgi:hypothetical protein